MNQRNMSCCQNGRTPGIVSSNVQQIANIYPAQTALMRGTLYPELDKPLMCAQSPSGCAEPTACQIMSFSAWEVRLYLNTHPDDQTALQLYQQLCQQTTAPNYACTFVPCTGSRWTWVDDPWPWEVCANGKGA